MGLKSIKIKLNNGTAAGMYILLEAAEVAYTKDNDTKPPKQIIKKYSFLATVKEDFREE